MADPRRTFDGVDQDAGAAIVVTWDGRQWCAEAGDHRYRSPFLVRVDQWVRDTLNLPPRAWINYEFRTGIPHLDKLIHEARQSRLAAYLAEAQARAVLADDQCPARSQRDLGVLLFLSHQRIHQLRAEVEVEVDGRRLR